jgi:alpha-L-fucosidase 2
LHRELFQRVTLTLGNEARPANEEMLLAAYDGEVPASLVQTMFEIGRYLLICSSRPGGWPANLQGLWNGDYAPAWNSDIHTDENIQMNYWQALPGGLPEVALPLFEYFEKHLEDFRRNAQMVFGCRGIFVAMTTNGREIPSSWSNWTAAAGWLAQHFYDYYLFTGDLVFLKRCAVPWLKEVALFYEDFLVTGDDGKLVFNPSLSPENRPANGKSMLCINATMDVAVCREVLSNLCDGCERLGIEVEGVKRWRAMLAKLPAYEINEDGAMKEWLHPAFTDNYHHRHQSHLYPVFPGLEITAESNPAIYEACRVAVEKRLVIGLTSQTGWSMAHMANIYARLGQGDRALECLEILTRSSTGPNLFTYHNDWRGMGLSCGWGKMPPFQIDANFGIAAAVLEMLVFSKPGLIKLLPALPAKWTSGRVTGIRCRGGVTVDMEWQPGKFTATLTSNCDQKLRLRLPASAGCRDVEMKKGMSLHI